MFLNIIIAREKVDLNEQKTLRPTCHPPHRTHTDNLSFYDDRPCHTTLRLRLTAFGLDEVFFALLLHFHNRVVMFSGDRRLFIFIFSAGRREHPSLTVHFFPKQFVLIGQFYSTASNNLSNNGTNAAIMIQT